MKYHDNRTYATNAIGITLDLRKLKFLVPEFFRLLISIKYWFTNGGRTVIAEHVQEHIQGGDSQRAIVVTIKPLIVAAYNEDIDCVVMLGYKKRVQRLFNFEVGTKLVCVNTFGSDREMQKDLIPGPKYSETWNMVYPVIAEMVSSDFDKIKKRRKEIGTSGYAYVQTL
ncbi:MAG: hypothetical protein ACI8SE_001821 [Bacteroidia bacterium]|jgi:hypothetical protein